MGFRFAPGCCCGCPPFCFVLKSADGSPLGGIPCRLTEKPGNAITVQTDATGIACVSQVASGSYTASVGLATQLVLPLTVSIDAKCCCKYTLAWNNGGALGTVTECCCGRPFVVNVTGCNLLPLPGARVTASDQKGTLIDQGTTDAHGVWTPTKLGLGQTYCFWVTARGFVLPDTPSLRTFYCRRIACAGSLGFALDAFVDPAFACCAGYAYSIKKALKYTDANGAHNLAWQVTRSAPNGAWYLCYDAPAIVPLEYVFPNCTVGEGVTPVTIGLCPVPTQGFASASGSLIWPPAGPPVNYYGAAGSTYWNAFPFAPNSSSTLGCDSGPFPPDYVNTGIYSFDDVCINSFVDTWCAGTPTVISQSPFLMTGHWDQLAPGPYGPDGRPAAWLAPPVTGPFTISE